MTHTTGVKVNKASDVLEFLKAGMPKKEIMRSYLIVGIDISRAKLGDPDAYFTRPITDYKWNNLSYMTPVFAFSEYDSFTDIAICALNYDGNDTCIQSAIWGRLPNPWPASAFPIILTYLNLSNYYTTLDYWSTLALANPEITDIIDLIRDIIGE